METTHIKNIEYQYLGEKSNFFSATSCRSQPQKSGLRTNHLGNVHLVLSDRKQTSTYDNTLAAYEYYPFGMAMQTYETDAYRYGFNGHEKDDEIYGKGNITSALFWCYDTRLGRRWNIDPVYQNYQSNYVVFINNPLKFIDGNGDKINLSRLEEDARNKILKDLSDFTGYNVGYDATTGLITLENDESVAIRSQTARDQLFKAVDSKVTLKISSTSGKSMRTGDYGFALSTDELERQVNSAPEGHDSRTEGYGMTFLHEMRHTLLFYKENDAQTKDAPAGKVEKTINEIRKELDETKKVGEPIFGKRQLYNVRVYVDLGTDMRNKYGASVVMINLHPYTKEAADYLKKNKGTAENPLGFIPSKVFSGSTTGDSHTVPTRRRDIDQKIDIDVNDVPNEDPTH